MEALRNSPSIPVAVKWETPMVAKLPAGTFYGKTQSRCEAAGFTFVESAYTAESQLHLPLHTHENAFFVFVIAGVCEESYGQKTRIVTPSTLVFHPAEEPHADRWQGMGGSAFHIDISQARAMAMRQYAPILGGPAEFHSGVVAWLADRLYREYQQQDNAALLAMEGLALEILAEASRHRLPTLECTPPRWLLRARELLHARFTQNFSLDDIASEVGVHPVHLSRVFRRHFECTPWDYVRKLRVDFACRQLAASDLPLSEIAISAGFSDQSHLTRTFGRLVHMTPGEYRRNFRSR
jgi:AraC family transcriptional regulator